MFTLEITQSAVNQRIDLRFESGCVGVCVRRKDSVNKRDERLLI